MKTSPPPYRCVASRPLHADEEMVLQQVLSSTSTADSCEVVAGFLNQMLGCRVSFLWSFNPDSPPHSWPNRLEVSDFFHLLDDEVDIGHWVHRANGQHFHCIKLPYSNAESGGTYIQMSIHDCPDDLFQSWWSQTGESFFWLVASNHMVRLLEQEYLLELARAKIICEKKTQLLAKVSDVLGTAGSIDDFLLAFWNASAIDFGVEHMDWWNHEEEARVSIGPAGSSTAFHVRPRLTESDCAKLAIISQYAPSVSPMQQWSLCIPVFSKQGTTLGVLSLYRSSHKFAAAECEIFDFVAYYLTKHMISWMNSEKMEMMVVHRTNVLQKSIEALTKETEERIYNEKLQGCLFQIASLASDIAQWPHFYERVHHILSEMIDVKNFYVALIDQDRQWIEFPYFVDQHYGQFCGRPFRHGLTEYVASTQSPVLLSLDQVHELQKEGRFDPPQETTYPSISWMGVPLIKDGQVFGVVAAQSYDQDLVYTRKDLAALSLIGQQIAQTFVKNQAQEELQAAYLTLEERVQERTQLLEHEIAIRKHIEQQLHHEAHHDPLTGLPNRKMLMQHLNYVLSSGNDCGVLFLDLDHFKDINDTHGHDVGDAVLVEFAQRLVQNIRSSDFVARLSGDEFVVVLADELDHQIISNTGQRIISAMQKEITSGATSISCSCSVGFVVHHQSSISTPEELIRKADEALYAAKKHGRHRLHEYEQDIPAGEDPSSPSENVMDYSLPLLSTRHLVPLVNVDAGTCCGYQAVLNLGLPFSDSFEPDVDTSVEMTSLLASSAGLYLQLPWPIHHAGHLYTSLDKISLQMGLPPAKIFVGLRHQDIDQDPFEALSLLWNLKALGHGVFVSDFGSGQTPASSLLSFPFDVIKINSPSGMSTADQKKGSSKSIRSLHNILSSLRVNVITEQEAA